MEAIRKVSRVVDPTTLLCAGWNEFRETFWGGAQSPSSGRSQSIGVKTLLDPLESFQMHHLLLVPSQSFQRPYPIPGTSIVKKISWYEPSITRLSDRLYRPAPMDLWLEGELGSVRFLPLHHARADYLGKNIFLFWLLMCRLAHGLPRGVAGHRFLWDPLPPSRRLGVQVHQRPLGIW